MAYRFGRSVTTGLSESGSVPALSHDIRVHLNIVIGFAELMLAEVPGKINEAQRRSLKDVLNSGRRLMELLHDVIRPLGSREG
jgi:signal transduction histidine kinase